jgi:vacuolar protein sorting-associated protein 13A/C
MLFALRIQPVLIPHSQRINAHQKTFELHFVVDSLQGSIYKSNADPTKPDRLLVEANFEGFLFHLAVLPYHMEIDVGLRSLELEDKIVDQGQAVFKHLMTSKPVHDGTRASSTSSSMSSASPTSDRDLVRVKYVRVQTNSPEFQTVFEGIDQSISIELSTINIMLTRVSVLVVYDWIMTTFVPEEPAPPTKPAPAADDGAPARSGKEVAQQPLADGLARKEMLRVRVKLTSIVLRLNNEGSLLATLTLSTADVAVLLRGNTLRVAARLGSLLLVDNAPREGKSRGQFRKLLSIDGDELADFTYETFDELDSVTYPGFDTAIWLRSGSLRFTFAEEPIRDLLQFFSKFARMKEVYDAATQAASAQASQLQARAAKLHYDVVIKTPIVSISRGQGSSDVLTANLGEIYAHNTFPSQADGRTVTQVEAGLRHIRLASRMRFGSQEYHLQMIDDVNISVDMTQREHLPSDGTGPATSAPSPARGSNDGEQAVTASSSADEPDMQIVARMSDVQIKLTEQQYGFIMALTQAIPRAFAIETDDDVDADNAVSSIPSVSATPTARTPPAQQEPRSDAHHPGASAGVDLLPELGLVGHTADGSHVQLHATLDLLFSVQTINLELYSAAATAQDTLHNASLARFALNGSEVKLKMLSDSSLEAEVALKSFTVSDTRPDKETKFREIIPAVRHDGHQFMLSYTASGGPDSTALALVTIDSPKVIFSLDPVFALLGFFMSAFSEADAQMAQDSQRAAASAAAAEGALGDNGAAATRKRAEAASKRGGKSLQSAHTQPSAASEPSQNAPAQSTMSFRVNIVDPTIILLAAPERSDTDAIVLSIRQVLMSQQAIMALKVDQFGMFMCRMDKPKESLRFLDNFDLTMSLDSRGTGSRQVTSIEIDVEPLVLRVSYRDIMMVRSLFAANPGLADLSRLLYRRSPPSSTRPSSCLPRAAAVARMPPRQPNDASPRRPAACRLTRPGRSPHLAAPPLVAGGAASGRPKRRSSWQRRLCVSARV